MTTIQGPIHSGFGPQSNAIETLGTADLSDKIAIVTGGASGIGLETTRALARAGANVIVPARDPDKARQALSSISKTEVGELDLLAPASIDSFARNFLNSDRPLHLLINNAGVMAVPLTRDARGFEYQFATNHLGHFQLTGRLWSALKRAVGARVVNLSSGAHRQAAFDFDDPNFEHHDYDKWKAYAQSKTASVLFTLALDRRGEVHYIRAFAVHPGMIQTNLSRYVDVKELQAAGLRDDKGEISAAQRGLYKTPQQGAATTVWCAVSPVLDGMGGVYCEDADIAQAVPADHRERNGVLPWATDPALAERLWTMSEEMTGVRF